MVVGQPDTRLPDRHRRRRGAHLRSDRRRGPYSLADDRFGLYAERTEEHIDRYDERMIAYHRQLIRDAP